MIGGGIVANILHKINNCNQNIVKNYLKYQLSQIAMEEFVNDSLEELRTLLSLDPANHIYPLMTAHLYISSNKLDNGRNILNVYEKCEKDIMETEPFTYAYYIFLKCLFFEDGPLGQKGSLIISRIAEHLPKDWRVAWLRLHIDESLSRNKHLNMHVLEQVFGNGCISPVMYLEMCKFLNENPIMLRSFESTLQSLLWGMKHNFLSQELMAQIVSIAQRQNKHHPLLYQLLVQIYTRYGDNEGLKSICHHLILGKRKDQEANLWFQKGIENQIRLNGIHEYYLASMDKECMDELPQTITRYFVYNTNIDEDSRAYLYCNVIYNHSQQLSLYHKQIVAFADEKLAKKQCNTFLARIYRYLLQYYLDSKNENKPETRVFCQKLLEVTFQHKIIIRNRKITSILVKRLDLDKEEKVMVQDGVAYLDIYSPYYYLYFIDKDNNRYSKGIDYTLTSILGDPSYIEDFYTKGICNEKSLIYLAFNRLKGGSGKNISTLELVADAASIKSLRDSFRSKLVYEVLGDYEDFGSKNINLSLLKSIDLKYLDFNDVLVVIEHYVNNDLLERAVEAIEKYGSHYFSNDGIHYLSSLMLEQGIYNKTMVSICENMFFTDAYDKRIVAYLVKYYDGPLNKLMKIWKKARDFDFNTIIMEERAIEQMLFTESVNDEAMVLVEHYSQNNPNTIYLERLLHFLAYTYLVGIDAIPRKGIELMRDVLLSSSNNLFEYAMIKYYSKSNTLSSSEKQWVEEMAQVHHSQKRLVSWYQNFGNDVKLPSVVRERTFIEYISSPEAQVKLFYRYSFDEEYKEQAMKQVAEGFFVGNVLVFYDEFVDYYIEETLEDSKKIVQSEKIYREAYKDRSHITSSSSSYEMINGMIYARKNNDDESLDNLMDRFIEAKNKISTYFKPL